MPASIMEIVLLATIILLAMIKKTNKNKKNYRKKGLGLGLIKSYYLRGVWARSAPGLGLIKSYYFMGKFSYTHEFFFRG